MHYTVCIQYNNDVNIYGILRQLYLHFIVTFIDV